MLKSITLFLVATLGLAAVAVAQQRAAPSAGTAITPPAGTSSAAPAGPVVGSTHVDPTTMPPYAAQLQKQIAALQEENKHQAHMIVVLVKVVSGLSDRFAHHEHIQGGKCFVAKHVPGETAALMTTEMADQLKKELKLLEDALAKSEGKKPTSDAC